LWHLGGFARPGGRRQDHASIPLRGSNDGGLDLVYGKGHWN
jgi:hypothetical protein